jgi:hypothetical protein
MKLTRYDFHVSLYRNKHLKLEKGLERREKVAIICDSCVVLVAKVSEVVAIKYS